MSGNGWASRWVPVPKLVRHRVGGARGVAAVELTASNARRTGGAVVVMVLAWVMFYTALDEETYPHVGLGALIGAGVMVAAVLLHRGTVECYPDGVEVQNVFFNYFIPWGVVADVRPERRVVIVVRSGRRYRLVAVRERHNASRRPRHVLLQEAVEQIEAYRFIAGRGPWSSAEVSRRIAWLSTRELAAVAWFGPGIYALGLWL